MQSAIGASRSRIERQLLTEALALSLAGALGGIVLAYRLLVVLVRWLPEYSFPHEVVIRSPRFYVPSSLAVRVWTQILVRTHSAPLAALNRVRAAVKAVDPDQQVLGRTRDLHQWIERTPEYSYGRLVSGMFAGFSFLALALAATGLFSVVSDSVAQRTNEFGIRMALGANGLEVLRLVFLSTASSVIGGLAGGMALSLGLSQFLSAEGSSQGPVFLWLPRCSWF